MRLTVRFLDGAVEVFDTDALTTESALGRTNALTDLRVALDDGLWVEASWHRIAHDDEGHMPLAQRSPDAAFTYSRRTRLARRDPSSSTASSSG